MTAVGPTRPLPDFERLSTSLTEVHEKRQASMTQETIVVEELPRIQNLPIAVTAETLAELRTMIREEFSNMDKNMDKRFEEQDKKFTDLRTDVAHLRTNVVDLRTNVVDLQTSVENLQASVGKLENDTTMLPQRTAYQLELNKIRFKNSAARSGTNLHTPPMAPNADGGVDVSPDEVPSTGHALQVLSEDHANLVIQAYRISVPTGGGSRRGNTGLNRKREAIARFWGCNWPLLT